MILSRVSRLVLQIEFAFQPGTARAAGNAQDYVPLDIPADTPVVVVVILVAATGIANVGAQN